MFIIYKYFNSIMKSSTQLALHLFRPIEVIVSQACGSVEAYQSKHNHVVMDVCHKAQNMVNKHCHEQGAMVGGHIQNNADCVKFLAKHDWSGHSKVPYPCAIAQCHAGNFVHAAACHGQKDEGAIIYADECGSAWLLAWSVKDNCGCANPNKVYAETGPIENYRCINWCDIKAKLDASCDKSYDKDECSGSEIYAKISPGKKPAVAAVFNKCY